MSASTLPHAPLARRWMGWLGATLVVVGRFGVPLFVPEFEGFRIALFSGFAGTLLVAVWWLFASGIPFSRRLGPALAVGAVFGVTLAANDPSMRVMWSVSYGVPLLALALVLWATAFRSRLSRGGTFALLVLSGLSCAPWLALRMEGISGGHDFRFASRWSATAEERFLASAHPEPPSAQRTTEGESPAVLPSTVDALAESGRSAHAWPGFRGPDRDATVAGVRIATDWDAVPPELLWRRPVGPGWSSFAVGEGRVYTQEQRGERELVACYDLATGGELWTHSVEARFVESMSGAGPRATPTLASGRVYALGATGVLSTLDAASGELLWGRHVGDDGAVPLPTWGFAASPLVVGDLVVVAAEGTLVAYDRDGGELRWKGPDGGASYSSPQRVTLGGVEQVLLLHHAGAVALVPETGQLLWQYEWSGTGIVQPALAGEGRVLISAGEGKGLRSLAVSQQAGAWSVEAEWETGRLKPNFNDFVVHGSHAYGFDGSRLACIDLADGARTWKGGRYGHGQLVLLPDQDLLVVLSEEGEVALVSATPGEFAELARQPALEGKTWNHPALVGNLLLVRNGEQMAALRLAPES